MYVGDFALEETFDIKFCTVTTTGAPTQLAGTPVVSAYPGNSLTQLTAGITLSVDFDSVTGLNNVRVVATAANGYATATNYALVITTGTVGGTSVVGYVVASFSINNRSALRPTTVGRTLDVSAGGEAGVDWANVGSPTTTQTLSGTTVGTSTTVGATGINAIADQVWDEVRSGHVTVGTFGEVTTTAAVADAVWDEARSGHVTAGTFGEGVASVQGDVTGDVDGNIAGDVLGDTSVADIQAAARTQIASATWDALRASYAGANTFGEGVASVQGSVTGNVNGNVIGTVASVVGNVSGNVVGSVGSVAGNVTGNVAGSVASVASAGMNSIADTVLTRNSSNWEATVVASAAAKKSLGGAVMRSTHRSRVNGATLEIFKLDDTVGISQTITTDPTNAPIDEFSAVT